MADYKIDIAPGKLWTPGPDGLVAVPAAQAAAYVPGYTGLEDGDRVLLNPKTQECLVLTAAGEVKYQGPSHA